MARLIAALAGLSFLAACGSPDEASAPSQQDPAPRDSAPLYAGKWAFEHSLCADGAWDFEEDGVSTAGEVSCSFTHIQDGPRTETHIAYEIDASCTAEGQTQTNHILLEVSEAAQTMRVSGGPWTGPIDLTRCTSAISD